MFEVTLCPRLHQGTCSKHEASQQPISADMQFVITELESGDMMIITCRYDIHGWLVQRHVLDKSELHCELAMGCSPLQTCNWLFDK